LQKILGILGKQISVFPTFGYFLDIGTLETLKRAEDDVAEGRIKLD
jgi:NDP-sugar pyrophosphorylase family protein